MQHVTRTWVNLPVGSTDLTGCEFTFSVDGELTKTETCADGHSGSSDIVPGLANSAGVAFFLGTGVICWRLVGVP